MNLGRAMFSAIWMFAMPAWAQQTETISPEALSRLIEMNVETVKLGEMGEIIRQGDEGWDTAGQTYPLLNSSYIMITDGNTIDKGSCSNAAGCSTNRYGASITLSAPSGWVFSRDSITISQSGRGANGNGVDGEPETRTVSLGGAVAGIDEITVKHFCHRAGGWRKGGCQSTLSVTAMAISTR